VSDEDTPPRGGAKRNTQYSHLNDRALLERTADRAQQAYVIARRSEVKIDAALAGRHPWYERFAPAAIAVVLLMMFFAYTMRTSAAAPEPSQRVQAAR
jgi:hypothetical protein